MAAGSVAAPRTRADRAHDIPTPARLAVTLVIASGLTLTGACANPAASPTTLPPAATPLTSAPPTSAAPTTAPSASTPPTSSTPPAPDAADAVLRLEASGPAVEELQQRLSTLGYWLGEIDGHYGQLTRQAVMAFQKAEGLDRDGVAGPDTRGKLPTASRPTPRTTEGDHIEVDLERQLLLVVRGGEVQWAFNTSTGNGEAYDRPSGGTGVARTPRGDFEIERQINGVREAELGVLYRPKYFHGGVAVHGSGSIPAHPASHGCVRVTNAAMDLLWASDVAPVGTEVHVY
ncbi:L,D-transpeptidase-like protein [Pseudonocardia hierapolitana]|uniref:L,D-transpeptidase-like protein n=1 Tax=Pseudonocardia hierapolitana TaxID=1128676 RepID=A0A561T2D9_9PSEU|nr:L,D-transpeptidase family protein [Pseudonocardia hierapolitana]TWF81271.1 L,D-transpeptidase-like protein [Pseudonocardia hierapolitana]